MKINIANTFKKAAKKLSKTHIALLEDAIEEISKDVEIGELKKGDLAGIRVYKFHIHSQLMLMAYIFEAPTLTLLSLSTHENFYRDLKRKKIN